LHPAFAAQRQRHGDPPRHPDESTPPSTGISRLRDDEARMSAPAAPEFVGFDEAAPAPPAIIHLPPPADLVPARKPRRQRRHVEQYRTDDAEHAELVARARDAGLSAGAYSRTVLLGDAGPRARRRAPVDRELLAHNNAALNRVGNNLNQLVRLLHRGDDLDPYV
jgi:hypothetical protein